MAEQNGQGTPIPVQPRADLGSKNTVTTVLCFAAVMIICVFFGTTQLSSNLSTLLAIVVALAVTATIIFLKNYSTLMRGFWLTLAVAGASVGVDALVAAQRGTTLIKALTAMVNSVEQVMLSAYGNMADDALKETLEQTTRLILKLIPSVYLLAAVLVVVLSFAACSFISKRTNVDLKIAPLSSLDFSPHVLWIPIAGLLAYSLSFLLGGYKDILVTVALNIAMATRMIFVVQATGVYGAIAEKFEGWGFVKVFLYFILLGLESVFFVMSVMGLLDFWRNFRRLPREKAHDEPSAQSV